MRREPQEEDKEQRMLSTCLTPEQSKTVAEFVTQFIEVPQKQAREWLAQFPRLIPDELVVLVSQGKLKGASTDAISWYLAHETDTTKHTQIRDLVQTVENRIIETTPNTTVGQAIVAEKSRKLIQHGLLWLIGGGVVTVWTYLAANPGETYVLAWGAMLWGAIDVVRGLAAR